MRKINKIVVLSIFPILISCKKDIRYENQFDSNGNLKDRYIYRDDILVGYEEYYENGRLLSEIPIENNMKSGKAKYYHSNGNLRMETYFENDAQKDTLKIYYESGQLQELSLIVDNTKNGIYKEYYESGIPRYVGTLKKGYKDGNFKYFTPNERVLSLYYDAGKLIYDQGDITEWNRRSLFGDSLRFRLPKNWSLDRNNPNTAVFADTNKSKENFRGTITILNTVIPKNVSFEQIVEQQLEDLKLDYPDIELAESGYGLINNYRSYQLRYGVQVSGISVKVLVTFYRIENKFYLLSCLGKENDFEEYLPYFQVISESIEVPSDIPV